MLMDIIYSRAEKVVTWMGADPRYETQLLTVMLPKVSWMQELLVADLKRCIKEYGLIVKPETTAQQADSIFVEPLKGYLEMLELPPISDSRWNALMSLFRRRWLTRIWLFKRLLWRAGLKSRWAIINSAGMYE
jgi:hypothetical protein